MKKKKKYESYNENGFYRKQFILNNCAVKRDKKIKR